MRAWLTVKKGAVTVDRNHVSEKYRRHLVAVGSGNQMAAAVLTLAEVISEFKLELGQTDTTEHAICMGIRKGLFGADAGDGEDVRNLSVTLAGDITAGLTTDDAANPVNVRIERDEP